MKKNTLIEARKIGDTCLEMLKTESDYHLNDPKLGKNVSILDVAVWVEKLELAA